MRCILRRYRYLHEGSYNSCSDPQRCCYTYGYLPDVQEVHGTHSSSNRCDGRKCDTEENRLNALSREYRKEFYGEGQYFWFLKAHGITGPLSYCSDGVTLVAENFVFPLPDAEVQYGWTEENEQKEESKEESAPSNMN